MMFIEDVQSQKVNTDLPAVPPTPQQKLPADRSHRAELALIEGGLGNLRSLGLAVAAVRYAPKEHGGRLDAVARIGRGKAAQTYGIEAKRNLTPGNLGAALLQLEVYPGRKLLIAEYVTPPLAARLRGAGVGFVDLAGNAYLEHPGTLIWVTGNRPERPARSGRPVRVFQPAGLRTVFALLCRPELANAPLRQLADAAGVALGTVARVVEDLRDLGYLRELGKRGRTLANRRKLLDTWVDAYPRQLRPKLQPRQFTAPQPGWWRRLNLERIGALLGGELAAAVLTNQLKPEIATLYLAHGLAPLMQAQVLLPPEREANVVVLPVFWRFDYPWPHKNLVPPLLVYADLAATGDDRNLAAARVIYDEHLARLVDEA